MWVILWLTIVTFSFSVLYDLYFFSMILVLMRVYLHLCSVWLYTITYYIGDILVM